MEENKSVDKIDWKEKISEVKNWMMDNKKIVSGIALLIVLIIVLFASRGCGGSKSESADASGSAESYQVNAISEVNELMATYYTAYANGDTDTVASIATPVSDLEKGYITLMSSYVDSYENLTCYTKSGLEDGSYFVSVAMEIKFTGIDTMAPGVETFYVRTNEEGTLYIDNLYSTFNLASEENALDETVAARIAAFEQEEDVQALFNEIEAKYSDALASDANLDTLVNQTMSTAVSDWLASYGTDASSGEDTADSDDTQTDVAATDDTATTDQTTEDTTADQSADTADQASEDTTQEDTTSSTIYLEEGKSIYLQEALVVRESMSETADRVGTAYSGETLTVVMSYAEGWTKVDWGGKTGYVKTELLANQ